MRRWRRWGEGGEELFPAVGRARVWWAVGREKGGLYWSPTEAARGSTRSLLSRLSSSLRFSLSFHPLCSLSNRKQQLHHNNGAAHGSRNYRHHDFLRRGPTCSRQEEHLLHNSPRYTTTPERTSSLPPRSATGAPRTPSQGRLPSHRPRPPLCGPCEPCIVLLSSNCDSHGSTSSSTTSRCAAQEPRRRRDWEEDERRIPCIPSNRSIALTACPGSTRGLCPEDANGRRRGEE